VQNPARAAIRSSLARIIREIPAGGGNTYQSRGHEGAGRREQFEHREPSGGGRRQARVCLAHPWLLSLAPPGPGTDFK
jgi:hypothetical protein